MATLASLVVRITGNSAQLNKAVDKAEGRLSKFRKGASKALKAVGKAATGLAAGGAIALAGFAAGAVKSFLDTGEALDKMSKRTGFSVEALGELKFAAEQSGSSIESIEKATKKMSAVIFDAGDGMKSAEEALAALGLEASDFKGLSPEAQFLELGAALKEVSSETERAALAQKVFGKAGTELLPLFDEGFEGMDKLRQQARNLGIVMSTEAAAGAAAFNDSMNELKSAALGVFRGLASELLPKLAEFARWLVSKKPEIQAFFMGIKEAATPFFEAFKVGVATVWPILQSFFQFIFANKPLLIAAIVAVGVAIASALGPVSLAVLAIVGIVTLIGFLKENWDTIWGAIESLWNTVSGAIVGIYNSYWGWILPAGPLIKAILFVLDNWEATWNRIKAIWETISGAIKATYDTVLDPIFRVGGLLDVAINAAGALWDVVWGAVQITWETVAGAIKTAYDSTVAPIFGEGGLIDVAISAVGLKWDEIWNEVEGIWKTVTGEISRAYFTIIAPIFGPRGIMVRAILAVFGPFKGMVNLILNGVNAIIGAWNSLEFSVPLIEIPSITIAGVTIGGGSIGGFTVGTTNLATLPLLAAGGNVMRTGSAIVGEKGPELVKLPRGAQVSPLDDSNGGMTINFYGPIYSVDDFDEAVNKARLRFRRAGN